MHTAATGPPPAAAHRPARRSCRASTTTCSRASPSARRRTRARSRAALADVADVEVAPPVKERADAERAMARARGAGPRRPARRDAHLRPGDARRARCWPRRRCRSAWRTSSPSPTVTAAWDMARPDLQPGHPRRAGHRQRDGPRRAAVPRGHRRLARGRVPRRGRALGARGRGGHALAGAEGRASFGYAMNGMGDIRVDVHALLRTLGPQVDALAPGDAAPRRRGGRPTRDVARADRRRGRALRDRPAR